MERVLRATLPWMTVLGLVMLVPTSEAANQTAVSYTKATGDLFPNQDRVDLFITVTAHVSWSLESGNLASGQGLEREVSPTADTLTVKVDYKAHPVCCPNAAWDGSHTFTAKTRVGCVDFPYSDAGWTLTGTICGTLHAPGRIAAGPGSWSPARLDWATTWDSQKGTVTANPDAQPAAVISVELATSYDFTAKGKISGWGQTYESDTYTFNENPGTPVVQRDFTLLQPTTSPMANSGSTPAGSTGHKAPGFGSLGFVIALAALGLFRRR